MKLLFLLFCPIMASAQMKTESFIIHINDHSMNVLSPEKKQDTFSVTVENKSLSHQIGKFVIGYKTLKFISVKSGKSETVEMVNKSNVLVTFFPLSPAFQEVSLQFGKKAYEIPSKK
jgi:hypothetical protein